MGSRTSTSVMRRRFFGFAMVSYFMLLFMAVTLSLSAAGVALYLIIDAYQNGVDHPVWADITLSLLLGVWVSGKPKLYSKKKVDTKEQ